jgi:hypothetical protein
MRDTFLSDWAFGLQDALEKTVQSRFPGEAYRWPLRRSFQAEGYVWRDSHVLLVLRDTLSQFPYIGELKPLDREAAAPEQSPSPTNIAEWMHYISTRFVVRPQDAGMVIPAVDVGPDVKADFDRWDRADKQLWRTQLAAIVTLRYGWLMGQTMA